MGMFPTASSPWQKRRRRETSSASCMTKLRDKGMCSVCILFHPTPLRTPILESSKSSLLFPSWMLGEEASGLNFYPSMYIILQTLPNLSSIHEFCLRNIMKV